MTVSSEILLYIILATALITIVAIILLIRAELRLAKLLRGKNAANLEESINTIHEEIKDMIQFRAELEQYLETVESRLKKSIQGVSTIRFNPFKGSGGGGNQSFATAFLNEKGDGVIISSLYSRDHISVFSKPIENSNSEFELSIEEKEALVKAQESTSSK